MSPYPVEFNPFGKPLRLVRSTDLSRLRSVAEGWFVEYKSEVPKEGMRAIAKSMCAFANQHGGWLIFGVKPHSGKFKVPESFPGLGESETRELERTVRNAADQHVSPSVEYRLRALRGPVPEIGLSEGREVLVVLVPEGARSPYIHSSGYIYRRFDDESRPEKDRFAIEALYERSSKSAETLRAFLGSTPQLSKGESEDQAFLHVYLLSDPLRGRGHFSRLEFDDFASIMGAELDTQSIGLPFDNAFMMSGGYVARQTRGQDPYDMAFTWKYFQTGCASLISVPLRSTPIRTSEMPAFLAGYSTARRFAEALESGGLKYGAVIDLCVVFDALAAIMTKHRRLAHADRIDGPFYAKAQLQNIWRRVPFWDSQGYVDFLAAHGLPVLQEGRVMAPPGTDHESLVMLPQRRFRATAPTSLRALARDVAPLFGAIVASLGIPPRLIADDEILEVGQRARMRMS